MTAEEISNIIKSELDNEKDFFNPHGINLKTSLIKPTRRAYLDSLDKTKKLPLWTVLVESQDEKGYNIFYNETECAFGLGIKSASGEFIALGTYGSFVNTLECM